MNHFIVTFLCQPYFTSRCLVEYLSIFTASTPNQMKKTFFALLALAVVVFASCKKSDDHANMNSNPLLKIMHDMHTQMDTMKMTMDPDYDFAKMMKVHHQGAVSMATYELANGTDSTIKSMAQKMKDEQTSEIAQLDSFMAAFKPSGMSMAMMDSMDAAMNRMSVQGDAQVLKNQSDHDFAHLMIVHHQSAVDMAKAAKMYAQTPFVKNMADMIIASQTAEIAAMQAWLAAGKD